MKIISVKSLEIPEVKVIRFARFMDNRGYFTETFRRSDLKNHPELKEFQNLEIVQANTSLSQENVARGLHFQWNPYMGKLVRTVSGRMIDIVLDIRKGSPTFGKAVMYDMPSNEKNDFDEYIWVPAGFAHGNFFTQKTLIEYFCTGEYSQGCEAGISPFSEDIDWSIANQELRNEFESAKDNITITDKDRNGFSLEQWQKNPLSDKFVYEELKKL